MFFSWMNDRHIIRPSFLLVSIDFIRIAKQFRGQRFVIVLDGISDIGRVHAYFAKCQFRNFQHFHLVFFEQLSNPFMVSGTVMTQSVVGTHHQGTGMQSPNQIFLHKLRVCET